MTAPKPNNFPWLSPYLMVRDIDQSVTFYKDAFQFAIRDVAKDEAGQSLHAELEYHEHLVMCGREDAYGNATRSPASSGVECPITLYVYVPHIEMFYSHAIQHGATSVQEPTDMFWGDRLSILKDPNGYHWWFATRMSEHK